MTPRELREGAAALNSDIKTTRDRLADALQSMDYEAALAHQMEMDRLEREARWLETKTRPTTISRSILAASWSR